jgi:class 3 adenylate cyclase/tetratricopeptide (TPR) repeat protein
MARRCTGCDASELPRESRYCLHCGAPVNATAEAGGDPPNAVLGYTPHHLEETLTRRSAQEGERKDVTVLVADVAGSLAMAHQLDPEDLHALMDGFFAFALDAVHAEHGTLNQFRGDGFMALFGAPVAQPNHASDAVRAALAIARGARSYTEQVRQRYGVPFVLRMGIHTGSVWVGSIGDRLRRDYTAEGPTVGLAVRLEQMAPPGEVLISGETAYRVRGRFALESIGPLPLRGSPGPAEAFVVLGPARDAGSVDGDAPDRVPFVGRVSELEQALAGIHAVAPGAAGWIELLGESGIGKSRLARELRTREGGPWREGRCRESSAMRAYDVWLALLRGPRGDDDERVLRAVRTLEGREGKSDPSECEAVVRAALDAIVLPKRPISILLEDVQWMDRSSWRLAKALLERPPTAGIRFLVTRRSDTGAPLEAPPSCVRIALAPLQPEQARSIALAVLSECEEPVELAVLAAERGAGHPLYVLEIARALGEGGDDLRAAARLEASWRRARTRLPTTLRGVIAARIDALPDDAKRLLEIAAVIGRPFAEEFLARVADVEGAAARGALVPLIERSLLVPRGGELDFGHTLHREVAYEQMLLARRHRLHRRCAMLIEEGPARESADAASEIGRHYDLAAEPRLAANALARAGELYLTLVAGRESVSHLRRAWELIHAPPVGSTDPSLRLRIGLALASALNTLDRAGEAASVLEAIDAGELTGSDRARLAGAWIEGAWVRFSETGDVGRPLALLERGLALAREDRRLEGRAHAYRIRICHLDGSIEQAIESARRVTELATAAGDRFSTAFGLGNEGYVLCDAGQIERARECCEEALDLARDARHEVAIALTASWLAKVHAFRGDTEAALEATELAREFGGRTAQSSAVYNAEIWTGYVHLLRDEPKRALEVLDRLAEINARWPTTLDWMALARLEVGRLDEAAALARRCLASDPPRLVRLRVLRTLGLAIGLAKHPDREAAEQAMGESLGLALELGLRPHVADVQQAFAELCRRASDDRRALYYEARAEREWEACGMPLHAERARAARVRDQGA